MKITASEVKHVLSQKHSQDFFLTEVKNGSTWMGKELAIMDALAIKKSWTKPCLTGYEIKVSRADFMNDEKWPLYKDLCHRFYFACPKGLILPEELPDDVGLVWINEDKKPYTRKKAKFRDIQMSADMFYYIILSRLNNQEHPFFSSKREFFEQYLLDKEQRRTLGWKVGTKMAVELAELDRQVQDFQRQKERMDMNQERFESFLKVMKKHGLNAHRFNAEEELDKALSTTVPPNFIRDLETIQSASMRLNEMIKNPELLEGK
ncbi:MmcB family DNA repair protein [Bacillus sp. B-jedd]|uniref:MmcB family DNA repair protein n=1 Tax=Bacillus sp. B-jedd TaxID=1476857 RepID=UPI0005156298|nr:MmcB family DNA repair protein [Bacillus sp. B-jedd]CEG02209.1 hypothetical protein BN1002_04786 [Bacillus sp. B-jedd]CEG25983.1 hypothetical protein BN1002_00821 [Bacillus sp. B-jedd]CEG29587.1 hypothetical protein BN1002_04545 [Bacillus sp. B-jedd]